ncbi:MAG: OmpH family outer membrane protein [Acidobacteria bacterium]|nr:OmpH family outer membrane protein [Acidobacteriota bacterium]MCI0621185.1 OmpH family outer membrane protein [Acidobacteriota bacterium]MCI0719804.1 OmpH family outer membrane protein [Acidobacteriota bacterium]
MNRKCVLWMAAFLGMIPYHLLAQGSAGKIGVLSVLKAISECSEGKQALGDFQKKADAKRDELEKKNNEIQELQKQLQSQARTLNDDSRAALAKSIDSKTTELQRAQDDAQKEFGQLQNEILGRIGNKVAPHVQKYAKENNFTIIVDSSNQNSQVIYSDPAIDITDEIIKRVDAAQTPAAATPAAKPK